MPKIYEGTCRNCGELYRGRGEHYCSLDCANEFMYGERLEDFEGELDFEELYPQKEAMVARTKIRERYEGWTGKLAVFSDLEIPFLWGDLLKQAVEISIAKGASRAVLGGDIFNSYAVSKHGKDKLISLDTERKMGVKVGKYLVNAFQDVVAIYGNHEWRQVNHLAHMRDFPLWKCLLQNGRPDLMRIVCDEVGIRYAKDWWVQLGQLIVAHASPYSSVWGKNITNLVDFFLKRPDMSRNFEGVCQGHSHQMLKGIYAGKFVFESGCLCREIDYNVSIRRTNPYWVRGFALVKFEQGHINFNESEVVAL